MRCMSESSNSPRCGENGHDSLSLCLDEINRTTLITSEEEKELGRRIRNGDETALDRLIRANLRFVVSVARQYANHGLSLEELIGEGTLPRGTTSPSPVIERQRTFRFG